jgi:cell wall assembly regulator SMI1
MADDVTRYILDDDLDGLRAAIAGGADLTRPDSQGVTPLARAVLRGSGEMVSALLEAGAPPDSPNRPPSQRTPLALAAESADVDIAALLLGAGANPGEADAGGYTPLHVAVSGESRDHVRLVELLLAAGADVNAPPGTVLPVACMAGSPEIVQALLAAGADVNRPTSIGTPLIKAVEWNRPRTVELLLVSGADPSVPAPPDYANHPEDRGRTPLEIARLRGLTHIQRLLEGRPRDTWVPPAGTVPLYWLRIELYQQDGRTPAPLRGPASEDQLRQVEQTCGVTLPEDVKNSYRLHDGQPAHAPGVIPRFGILDGAYAILPTESIIKEWEMFNQYRGRTDLPDGRIGADPGIRNTWWLPAWVPFAANWQGDYLMIDLDPAPGGTPGQIITFNHEKQTHYLVAPSTSALLRDVVDALESNAADAAGPVWP